MNERRVATDTPGPVAPELIVAVEDAPPSNRTNVVPGRVDAPIEPLDGGGDVVVAAPARVSYWGTAVWLLAATVAGFSVYSLVRGLIEIWQRDWVGGAVLGTLSLGFLAALLAALLHEFRALRRLHDAARLRTRLETALRRDSPGELMSALAPVLSMVAARRPELVQQFHHRIDGQSDSDAIVRQFRTVVLSALDQEARRAIRRETLVTLGAAAASPHPALDAVIVAWRSVVMVRRVAEIYGLRPSGLATIRLARAAVISTATAMAADPAGDMLAEALGGGFADKIAGKVAEGSIVGLRALRFGLRAMDVCRPLSFEPDERKSLLGTLMNT
ncbi:MAG TPA: DUF697 domain-containing protein [Vineibacter sp.]|nr:DUF697 domain-containing protein [Vineibacter sp.]